MPKSINEIPNSKFSRKLRKLSRRNHLAIFSKDFVQEKRAVCSFLPMAACWHFSTWGIRHTFRELESIKSLKGTQNDLTEISIPRILCEQKRYRACEFLNHPSRLSIGRTRTFCSNDIFLSPCWAERCVGCGLCGDSPNNQLLLLLFWRADPSSSPRIVISSSPPASLRFVVWNAIFQRHLAP